MAISVKDIQEKEFGFQKEKGYNVDEVDDFLDEIATQMKGLIRENVALEQRVENLEQELEEAKSAAATALEEAKKDPTPDDESYFKNLQSALRESLIGSQRIADETTAEARREAEQTVADAKTEAEKLLSDAKAEVENLVAEKDGIKKAIDDYRANFRKLIEDQAEVIKNNLNLFD